MATKLSAATKVNPRYYNGPKPQTRNVLPTDSVTFKAGQLGYFDSDGLAEVVGDDGADVDFIFATTRDAALTSTKAKAHLIDADTEFVFAVVNGTTDALSSQTMVGGFYSIEVISNVCCLDLDTAAAHSNDVVKVTSLMSDNEPKRYTSTDTPGWVVGHVIRTASQD